MSKWLTVMSRGLLMPALAKLTDNGAVEMIDVESYVPLTPVNNYTDGQLNACDNVHPTRATS